MPKFRRFLRRQSSVQRGPILVTSDQTRQPRTIQPETIDLNVPGFDLANAEVKEITIGCWLDTRMLKWGLHNQQDTAIMHLTIEASHEYDFELDQFQVDLAFSTPGSDQIGAHDPPSPACGSEGTSRLCTVYLCSRPAPLCVQDDQETAWRFSGHRIAPQGGPATIARWVWSALRPTSSTADCRNLYCGVVIRHGGPGQPILIKYHIEGQARQIGKRYQRPYRFNSRSQGLQPWLLKPSQAVHQLTDSDIERMDEDVLKKYRRHCIGKYERRSAPSETGYKHLYCLYAKLS